MLNIETVLPRGPPTTQFYAVHCTAQTPQLSEDWDDYHAFTRKAYLASCIRLTSAINTALTSHLLFPTVFVAACKFLRVLGLMDLLLLAMKDDLSWKRRDQQVDRCK